MRLRHLVPFAILLAWQVAPFPGDSTPPRRRFSLTLGYALAQLEDYAPASFNCDGSLNSPERSEQVTVQSVGVQAEMVTSDGLRVAAFGGSATTNSGWAAGPFGGVTVAHEGARLGIGAGVTLGAMSPNANTSTSPDFYLRIGPSDAAHFRVELGPQSESGVASYLRTGVGFNQGSPGRVSGFVGAGVVPNGGGGELSYVAFADLAIPTSTGLDVLLRGQLGQGHQFTVWGLGLGARYRFGH